MPWPESVRQMAVVSWLVAVCAAVLVFATLGWRFAEDLSAAREAKMAATDALRAAQAVHAALGSLQRDLAGVRVRVDDLRAAHDPAQLAERLRCLETAGPPGCPPKGPAR